VSCNLYFSQEKVFRHLSSCDPNSVVQCRDIKRRREGIRKAERQHKWNPAYRKKGWTVIHGDGGRAQEEHVRTPNIFQGPTSLMHLVLFGDTTAHDVHVTGSVPLHLQRARLERPLLPGEDVEVVVGRVEARVALRAERRAKDDEVLGDARVDDVHRAHRAAGVVEDPFGAVRVERYARARIAGGEIAQDVRDHAGCVVGRGGERGELQLVEMHWVEDVPSVLGVK
jgi:hypothetical protein